MQVFLKYKFPYEKSVTGTVRSDSPKMLTKQTFLKKLGFSPCKAEQPLQGMKIQEKYEKHTEKHFRKNPKIEGVYYFQD